MIGRWPNRHHYDDNEYRAQCLWIIENSKNINFESSWYLLNVLPIISSFWFCCSDNIEINWFWKRKFNGFYQTFSRSGWCVWLVSRLKTKGRRKDENHISIYFVELLCCPFVMSCHQIHIYTNTNTFSSHKLIHIPYWNICSYTVNRHAAYYIRKITYLLE